MGSLATEAQKPKSARDASLVRVVLPLPEWSLLTPLRGHHHSEGQSVDSLRLGSSVPPGLVGLGSIPVGFMRDDPPGHAPGSLDQVAKCSGDPGCNKKLSGCCQPSLVTSRGVRAGSGGPKETPSGSHRT